MKKIVQNIIRYESNLDLENPRPRTINLEVTNICDLRCIMCKRIERPKGYLRLELLKEFLPEAKHMGVQQAGLFTVGEPILHPQIGEIVELCKNQGFYTYIDVNGNSLTEEKAHVLVDSGLDSIKFSIAAADEDTYARIHRGGSLSNVYNNLKTLKKIRDEKHSRMRILVSFIIMQENQHQIELFREKMRDYTDEIEYTVVNNAADRMDRDAFEALRIDTFDIPNKNGICSNPWTRIVMSWDGYISLCCIDYELDISIGKYEKGNLNMLFTGQKAKAIRRAMLEKRYDDLPVTCNMCERLKYDVVERAKRINEQFK